MVVVGNDGAKSRGRALGWLTRRKPCRRRVTAPEPRHRHRSYLTNLLPLLGTNVHARPRDVLRLNIRILYRLNSNLGKDEFIGVSGHGVAGESRSKDTRMRFLIVSKVTI